MITSEKSLLFGIVNKPLFKEVSQISQTQANCKDSASHLVRKLQEERHVKLTNQEKRANIFLMDILIQEGNI